MELTCLRSLALKEMGFIGRSMCDLVFFLVIIYIQENADCKCTVQILWTTIHPCYHHLIQHSMYETFSSPQKISLCLFQVNPWRKPVNNLSHHSLVLLILNFNMNGSKQCVLFSVWLPSVKIIILKFINLCGVSLICCFFFRVVFHCMDIPCIAYLLICWWTFYHFWISLFMDIYFNFSRTSGS